MSAFDKFLLLSGLKPNKPKCELASIVAPKGILLVLCGMDCIDLKINKNFSYTFF